ncbi:ABC transporter ATP-binding protein [Pseudomonas gregormendelii]|uniref:Spermidine/putrescine import ATP-binding protein PotA n=1 Tax=Pseudomonas gregormendelii TaxID=1628277 RepID=A0ABS3AE03_9PSED|nr:ABC transporter ATP-binding protein [Pseudomonas gregormendelii]MBN3965066.1 ABC transporter ATP-binding protein [Pseudomonas gregormendelii]
MSVLLSIDSVCKNFGPYQALDNINLDIEQGEFIVLLGPSGCGKTTLLRSIAGFMQPDSGSIAIDGQDVSRLPPYRRPLNTVFQNYALFPHMTVLENVAYGPRRQGVNRGEARERAREALALVGLEALGERYPSGMSGGQQQRVALARAIVNKPKLLLLDEPLSALDMKLRKRMQLELKHLQAKLGIAFIFVTHDQEEAMTIADRIVVMNAGRIEQTGTSSAIYSAPASRFVADFIGEANLIDYQVTGNDEIRLGIRNQPLVRNTSAIPSQGVAVLRPEHLQVLEPAAAETPGCHEIHGTVSDVVTVGSHTLIHALIDGQMIIARTMGFPGPDMVAGSTVRLGFNPAHLHLIGESV